MPDNFDYERLVVLLGVLATLIVLNRNMLSRLGRNLFSRRDKDRR